MAEDEDGVSNKKSAQNSNNGGSSQENEQNITNLPYFPRLLTPESDEAKCDNSEDGDASSAEAKSSSSKSTGAPRKEENPFSFRHFLKRDLSLPGTSTYEHTGARPKVYAGTVRHSPTRPDAAREPRARERSAEPRAGDDAAPSGSGDAARGVADDPERERDPYGGADSQPYRPAPERGMPSLPDFVRDHMLAEQAYLNGDGPLAVEPDNLPDFTFNTNYVAGAGSLGRRARGYAAGLDLPAPAARAPLDLPPGAEAAPAPDHPLSLDLTESVNPADRRNMSPRSTFPLDLPPNAGAESMRLPDFLPVNPGRTSPVPEASLQPLLQELERTRSELNLERRARARLEDELLAVRAAVGTASTAGTVGSAGMAGTAGMVGTVGSAGTATATATRDAAPHAPDRAHRESPESESSVNRLRIQIRRLQEELASSQAEVRSLRSGRAGVAADLRVAADTAEASLRDLLSGLERLRSLSRALEPP